MTTYAPEVKDHLILRMLDGENVYDLADETAIPVQTLYCWRRKCGWPTRLKTRPPSALCAPRPDPVVSQTSAFAPPALEPEPRFATIAELAALLRCSQATIRNRVRNGALVLGVHYLRPCGGRVLLFDHAAILRDSASPSRAQPEARHLPTSPVRQSGETMAARKRGRARKRRLLKVSFTYRGARCMEPTGWPDTAANRRRVASIVQRVERAIADGTFDYATAFPGSTRAASFACSGSNGSVKPGTALSVMRTPAPAQDTAPAHACTLSFGMFSEHWQSAKAAEWRALHQVSVRHIFIAHLLPAFGARELAAITEADLACFREMLGAKPGRSGHATLQPATVNKVLCVLRQFLAAAAEKFGLPDLKSSLMPLPAERPHIHPFSRAEVDLICTRIPAEYRDYAITRFHTGLRSGEINGLRWQHVDFDTALIRVREAIANSGGGRQMDTSKWPRDVPMLPVVKAALQRQWCLRLTDSDYVFTNSYGGALDSQNFANRVWYPLLDELGLRRRRPYQTRHTTAALMLADGADPASVAALMGQSDAQALLAKYPRHAGV